MTEQIEKGRSELEYIDSVLDTVSRAESERELAQIREELTEQGYLRKQKGKQRPQAALPPLEFTSSDGFKILVGRNNTQNDKLTLKIANKNDKTYILAIGAITNVAIAINKEPKIVDKIEVIWLGGNSFLSKENKEFNFKSVKSGSAVLL